MSDAIPPNPIFLHGLNGNFHVHELNEISNNVKTASENQYVPILNMAAVF
jgi:hypothetical protein